MMVGRQTFPFENFWGHVSFRGCKCLVPQSRLQLNCEYLSSLQKIKFRDLMGNAENLSDSLEEVLRDI